VPYDSYRAMASLRAPRVPVFLEREALPAWLAHPAARVGGLVVAAAALAARFTGLAGDSLLIVAAVGAAPQGLVWLQSVARVAVRAVTQARQGV